ncbi:cupin domain-containing protein [Lysobacter arenosi]|uniref:Cupin domain-containing protein n=1 Tax=Lysobacter arenosi TaxID=2795387 RepID=A0ABX7RCQ3_9GAMM|nr:cupin domain-containing protein [Lysobacter arenosi]QSX74681.1 cupin domain-containing protein [Lysobacter arenosi]
MRSQFPSPDDYSAQTARFGGLTVVDVGALHATVTEAYRNDVLANVNGDCMRLSVFEGEYRWHRHPDSDELFLVVEGRLQIDLAGRETVELAPWQFIVVPAGTVHRTRAIGRTVNLTFEQQGARTEFLDEEG